MTRKHIWLLLTILLTLSWPILMPAQSTPQRQLGLQVGPQQVTLLDLHATPLIHKGPGFGIQLDFARETESSLWEYNLSGGLLRFQPSNEELAFKTPFFSGTFVQFGGSHLRSISQKGPWSWYAGGMIRQMAIIDFDGIGDFPWIFAQGALYAQGRLRYQLAESHRLEATLALPLLNWITDMPYEHIPRLEGQAPGVGSAIRTGTRLATWDSFQKVLLEIDYSYQLNSNWALNAQYQGTWMHDAVPNDMWAYRNGLFLGINYQW